MTGYKFTFAGGDFVALGSGALFWPSHNALIVADLHLGKSERMARRGGVLLPPFETQDTLARLRDAIKTTEAKSLFLLGDVFDDNPAREALSAPDSAAWRELVSDIECISLAGNHDPTGPAEMILAGIAMRHIAAEGPDISGHFHPKARLRNTIRPVFVIGQNHLILPAFGTFTGGLFITDPALVNLVPSGLVVMTGSRPVAFPISTATSKQRI